MHVLLWGSVFCKILKNILNRFRLYCSCRTHCIVFTKLVLISGYLQFCCQGSILGSLSMFPKSVMHTSFPNPRRDVEELPSSYYIFFPFSSSNRSYDIFFSLILSHSQIPHIYAVRACRETGLNTDWYLQAPLAVTFTFSSQDEQRTRVQKDVHVLAALYVFCRQDPQQQFWTTLFCNFFFLCFLMDQYPTEENGKLTELRQSCM